jgi:prepilin peptidase CpaA
MTETYMWGMALGLLVTAAGTDMVSRRVPNELIALGVITGGYLFVANHSGGVFLFLWRLFWPILLLYLLYLIGGLGAGDIKLIGCLGLYLPSKIILWVILYSLFIGGAVGFLQLFQTRQLRYRCSAFLHHIRDCLSYKQISAYDSTLTTRYDLHFAVEILCGAVLCWLKEGVF